MSYSELFLPNSPRPAPVVVLVTGDGPDGTKGQTQASLKEALLAKNIGVFMFDFQGLGGRPGDSKLLSLSRGIQDLEEAISELTYLPGVDFNRSALFASSFGASVCLASPSLLKDFKAFIFKSPAVCLADAYLHGLTPESLSHWRASGFHEGYQRDISVLLDAVNYSGYQTAREFQKPCLILHGLADQDVPPIQAEALATCWGQAISPKPLAELDLIPGVGHRFDPEIWPTYLAKSVSWLQKHLEPQLEPKRTVRAS